MSRRERSRQVDVARLAKVTPAVVSKVLGGRKTSTVRVSPETAARVREAARELGYSPNPIAQSLAGANKRLIGVLTFEPLFMASRVGFYFDFLTGIEKECEEQAYDLLLFTRYSGKDSRGDVRSQGNRLYMADGSILLGREPDREQIVRLAREDYPFVFIGRRYIPQAPVSYVATDYAMGTDAVVSHLLALGHSRFTYIGSANVREPELDREEGYSRALLTRSGIDSKIHRYRDVDELSASDVRAWLNAGTSAFVVENAALARRLEAVAEELSLRSPRDFSFGVLGDAFAVMGPSEIAPHWTHFAIPRQEIGRQAVRLLLEILTRPDSAPLAITVSCDFIPGSTTGAVPGVTD